MAPDLERIVKSVGRNKIAPDMSAEERFYSRSLSIRKLVMEFLVMNEGTAWSSLMELYARAANYAGCSSTTAARWVFQFTRAEAGFQLTEAVDHFILERR